MKTFFNYFKGRGAVEKTGNRVADSDKSAPSPQTTKHESPTVRTGSRPDSGSRGRNIVLGEKPAVLGTKGPEVQEIILELGDFLKRIPPEFLRPGDHQPTREVRFEIDEVANNIAHGKSTIPLSEIVKRCPEIFKNSVVGRSNIDIFFPWQKLARQVDILRSYRFATKHDAEKPGNSSNKTNVPAWYSRSGNQLPPENLESDSKTPLGTDTRGSNISRSNAARLTKDQQSDSTAGAPKSEETAVPGEVDPRVLKAREAELMAERDTLLIELENSRLELEQVRMEAAQVSSARTSLENAERDVEALRSQLREAIAAKIELEESFKKTELDIKTIGELQRKVEKAVEERENASRELEVVRAEMQTLRETSSAAKKELVIHAAEIEKARGIAEARVRELEQHMVDLGSKFELLTVERDQSAGEVPQLRAHHTKLIASLKNERDNAFASRDELREEMQSAREKFRKKIDILASERDALKREKLQFTAQMDQLLSHHKKQIDFLNSDTEKRIAALNRRVDVANAEREEMLGKLKSQRERFNAEIEGLRTERIALVKARDEAIAQERETRHELEDELAMLRQECNREAKG